MGDDLDATPLNSSWIARSHSKFNITSWSLQTDTPPMVVEGGEGCWFWDSYGKRYLDFQSQLVNLNLGHQHPDVVRAIQEQAGRLCYIGPSMANDMRSRLAHAIAQVVPGDLKRTFFTTGGAASVETAVRLARQITGRQKIIARYRSYHGATAGALALTGDPRRWLDQPGLGGVVRILDPYCFQCPNRALKPCNVCQGEPHLEEILQYESAKSIAAVIVEPITGTNGILVPPDGYLKGLREVCDRHGIILIFDEVMSGFGRTGKWFACDHWGVAPDIMCVAKGLNSGYVPLGAMVVSERFESWLKSNSFPGGLTYSGHPLACASGVASLEVYHRDGIIENAARQGSHLGDRLKEIALKYPIIGDVRGKGLFWAVELVKNSCTREPLVPFNAKGPDALAMSRIISSALEDGLYLSSFSNIVRLAPPLIVTKEEIDHGCDILERVINAAQSQIGGS